MKTLLLLALLGSGGCALFRTSSPEGEVFIRPAGVVRHVNTAERYLIFESSFVFRPGQELQAMRDGRAVAEIRVLPQARRPFFAADILEGAPRVDDLVE
ncbi:MAG: hypothetical protein JJU29_08685 [Verrucomicrobia bacterium]|nr:hypothetical protein [Verrucomicrobiota bacterium]MCH8511240.1 hypothetical protein [Kiritimatiellia bacterium]